MKDLQNHSLIKDSVSKLYEAKQEKKEFDNYYNNVCKKEQVSISNYMFTNLKKGQESFEVMLDSGREYYTNHKKLKVTRVRTKKVIWLIGKLKKSLPPDKYKQIVNREYVITDYQGLVKYLKKCGVDPKKFKKFISVEEELDEKKLDFLYETGIINRKELDGTYELKVGEPYIKLTEIK